MSLKSILLFVLDTAITVVPGPVLKAALGIVRWAVNKFVPDTVAAPPMPLSAGGLKAAPDEVKAFIDSLFAAARPYVKSSFVLRIYDGVVAVFEGVVLDKIWDSLVGLQAQPLLMGAFAVGDAHPAAAELDAALTELVAD